MMGNGLELCRKQASIEMGVLHSIGSVQPGPVFEASCRSVVLRALPQMPQNVM